MNGDRVKSEDSKHVFHSWSAQRLIDPLPVASASGVRFTDHGGRSYLDFSSGLVHANLGYQHPDMVAGIQAAADQLCTLAPGFAWESRSTAARLIAERTPGDLDSIFFTNGGAEATENAIRMARLHTGRHKVLAAYRSYHGATAGSITLTGEPRRWPSEPAMAGVVHFWGPYAYRSAFHATDEEQECERALAHLSDTIMVEGGHTIAALILESIVGTNGVLVPPEGYLAGVRRLCDEHGIVMVADEVMSGFGRAGQWFAIDQWGVVPDLLCFAKGVNSGYVPIGGVAISAEIAATFDERPYPGGLTYSGHPLACASVVTSIGILERDGIIERSRAVGADVLGPGLRELARRHPSVGEVRGMGCFWALDLVTDRATRTPLVPFNASGAAAAPMGAVAAACTERGLWPMTAGNRLHVVPPLVIGDEEIEEGLAILDQALTVADGHYTGSDA